MFCLSKADKNQFTKHTHTHYDKVWPCYILIGSDFKRDEKCMVESTEMLSQTRTSQHLIRMDERIIIKEREIHVCTKAEISKQQHERDEILYLQGNNVNI